jgi:hypothetical protein
MRRGSRESSRKMAAMEFDQFVVPEVFFAYTAAEIRPGHAPRNDQPWGNRI